MLPASTTLNSRIDPLGGPLFLPVPSLFLARCLYHARWTSRMSLPGDARIVVMANMIGGLRFCYFERVRTDTTLIRVSGWTN